MKTNNPARTLHKKGYKFSDNQHNGSLYTKLVSGYLYRAVINSIGQIRYYKPIKPNKYQKEIFG